MFSSFDNQSFLDEFLVGQSSMWNDAVVEQSWFNGVFRARGVDRHSGEWHHSLGLRQSLEFVEVHIRDIYSHPRLCRSVDMSDRCADHCRNGVSRV